MRVVWRRPRSGRLLGDAFDLNYQPSLIHLYNNFACHPDGENIMAAGVCRILYTLVQTHRPQVIVDVGTGIGCALAFLLKASRDAGLTPTVFSFESLPAFIEKARQTIPRQLLKNTQILPLSNDQINNIAWSTVDLVVIDGEFPLTKIASQLSPGSVIMVEKRSEYIETWRKEIPWLSWELFFSYSRCAEMAFRLVHPKNPEISVYINGDPVYIAKIPSS